MLKGIKMVTINYRMTNGLETVDTHITIPMKEWTADEFLAGQGKYYLLTKNHSLNRILGALAQVQGCTFVEFLSAEEEQPEGGI